MTGSPGWVNVAMVLITTRTALAYLMSSADILGRYLQAKVWSGRCYATVLACVIGALACMIAKKQRQWEGLQDPLMASKCSEYQPI